MLHHTGIRIGTCKHCYSTASIMAKGIDSKRSHLIQLRTSVLVLRWWPLSTGFKRKHKTKQNTKGKKKGERKAELKAAPQSSFLVPNSAEHHSSFPHLWIEK